MRFIMVLLPQNQPFGGFSYKKKEAEASSLFHLSTNLFDDLVQFFQVGLKNNFNSSVS